MKKTIYYTINYEFYGDVLEVTGNITLDVYEIDLSEEDPVMVKIFSVETSMGEYYQDNILDYMIDNGHIEHENECEIILL